MLLRITYILQDQQVCEIISPRQSDLQDIAGHPKLIPVTHRQWYDQTTRLTPFPGRVVCSPMPMFHVNPSIGVSSVYSRASVDGRAYLLNQVYYWCGLHTSYR